MWTCKSCVEYYDPNQQADPIKDPTDSKLIPYTDLLHYPTADAEDLASFEAIHPDKQEGEEGLENRSYEDQRVEHINLHNVTSADAILRGALTSKKKSDDDNV